MMEGYEWAIGFALCVAALVLLIICVRARLRCPMGGNHNLEAMPKYGALSYGCTKCGMVVTGIDRKEDRHE